MSRSFWPDDVEIEIERIAQGGDGVGRWQGRVVFAAGGLPGERVHVRLQQRKADYARGIVVDVVVSAPERVTPRLPGTSHMPWQHIAYDAQLRFKQAIVAEQLTRLAGLADVTVAPVIAAAHPWHYRNTAHLHVQSDQAAIGYYAAGSHQVIDLPEDPLLLPVLNEALMGLRHALPHLRHNTLAANLQQVTLRGSATHGYAVGIVQGTGDLAEVATRWHRWVPALAGVAVPEAASTLRLHEELGGVVFSLSPTSFFQVHTAQTETLLDIVREGLALEPGTHLLDAYSGAGTFALPLARELGKVVAIEEHAGAVDDGQQSALLNQISNVTFITAPVERVLPELETRFESVVLDPPRRGCHPAALKALIALAPRRIAYISCHPGILARDMLPLVQAGYRLVHVQPVDLFPQTPHIESVTLLHARD